MSAETTPDTREVADALGVDDTLLDAFVSSHPDPTPAIVLGWARTRGELRSHPEQLRPDVATWLDERPNGPREAAGAPSEGGES